MPIPFIFPIADILLATGGAGTVVRYMLISRKASVDTTTPLDGLRAHRMQPSGRSARAVSTIVVALGVAAAPLAGLRAQSQWCAAGSVAIQEMPNGPQTAIAEVMRACKPGDMIGIPGNFSVAIGKLCDFSKQIVAPPNGPVVCAIRAP